MYTCHPISTELGSNWKLSGRPWLIGNGVFVQKTETRGQGWLRLSLSYTQGGTWYVTRYKSKKDAVQGEYGNGTVVGFPFKFGGPNVWGV